MDPKRYTRVKEILLAVRTLHGEARHQYLDNACSDDPDLRREVESLLPHDTTAPAILDEGALEERIEGALAHAPEGMVPPPLPDSIGPYRILGVLGEGGMGVVYEAEQTEPIRRKVALKLIRRGLDTDRVVARFDTERQALARMDHPGIARVLDAGADSSGRPFFVMELVDGVPITEFCRSENLDVPARLRLFRLVCQAVEHAHRKGIIHRDLKPSNVMVSTREGSPSPKIIDFGIAKATNQSSTDEPALTQEGHLIGTPEYMSPEQADGSGNVDTRTDVYSLGVLLFEVLTGEMPYHFDTHRYSEIQRVLRETVPQRPSQCVPDGPGADRLRKQLSGDLDNIVLMALRREADRRYRSVERMEDDLRRHLEGQPVTARKDTWTYRTGKFVQRNRTGVAAGGVIAALLIAFAFTLARKSAEVVVERDRAVAAERVASAEAETARQVSDFLANLFELSSPGETHGNSVTAREILDRGAERVDEELADQPVVRGHLLYTLGGVYHGLGIYDKSEEMLRNALELQRDELGPRHADVGRTLSLLCTVLHDTGEYDQSVEAGREGLAILRESLGTQNRDVALTMSGLAVSLQSSGNLEEAEPLFREAADIFLELDGPESDDFAWCTMSLGYLLHAKGDDESAVGLYETALATQRRLFPQAHPDLAATINHLGGVRMSLGELDVAEPLFRESLEMYHTLYPDGHAALGVVLHNLGVAQQRQGRYEDAETSLKESLAVNRRILGNDHPYVAFGRASLGSLFLEAGRMQDAERELREAVATAQLAFGEDHPRTGSAWLILGSALRDMGRPGEAREAWNRALAIQSAALPEDHPDRLAVRDSLATLSEAIDAAH
ncbi:MAG: hypothetical protein DHS20C21_09740 [Gemmatimonadota bacterium]|nr:MAG: hypothetical protein DHS20C21_09740 [Gemmatimonadota bacterium]